MNITRYLCQVLRTSFKTLIMLVLVFGVTTEGHSCYKACSDNDYMESGRDFLDVKEDASNWDSAESDSNMTFESSNVEEEKVTATKGNAGVVSLKDKKYVRTSRNKNGNLDEYFIISSEFTRKSVARNKVRRYYETRLSFVSPEDEFINIQRIPKNVSLITGFLGSDEEQEVTGIGININKGFPSNKPTLSLAYSHKDFDSFILRQCGIYRCDLSDTCFTNSEIYCFTHCDFSNTYFENFIFYNFDLSFEGDTCDFEQTKNFKMRELKHIYGGIRGNITYNEGKRSWDKLNLSNFVLEDVHYISVEGCNLENAHLSNCKLDDMDCKTIESTRNYKEKTFIGNWFEGEGLDEIDFSGFNLTGCCFSFVTNVNFEDAIITSCRFQYEGGVTLEQIKSTWNWKNRLMDTVVFPPLFQKIVDEERQKEGF